MESINESRPQLTDGAVTEFVSRHAHRRMNARGIGREMVEQVLAFGRVARIRGAEIYAVGRREVQQWAERGVDLREAEGVQVVCSLLDGTVITVYRNRDFRGLKPRGPRFRRVRNPFRVQRRGRAA